MLKERVPTIGDAKRHLLFIAPPLHRTSSSSHLRSIDVTGHATNVDYESTLDHQLTETCMVEVFRHAVYPQPDGGDITFTKTILLQTASN